MPNSIIEGVGLVKTYNLGGHPVEVLKGVDLVLHRGERVAVVGPSGSGKSTLLYLLGLLESPTSGRFLFEGRDMSAISDNERSRIRLNRIGFIFQFHHLLPEFTALENVMLPGLMRGKSPGSSARRAGEVLEKVGLAERFNHKPGELSGGERQRVTFARALMNSPDLLLADEPTGNLDHEASKVLETMMWELCSDQETALLLVTHNNKLAEGADLILQLEDGCLMPALDIT